MVQTRRQGVGNLRETETRICIQYEHNDVLILGSYSFANDALNALGLDSFYSLIFILSLLMQSWHITRPGVDEGKPGFIPGRDARS